LRRRIIYDPLFPLSAQQENKIIAAAFFITRGVGGALPLQIYWKRMNRIMKTARIVKGLSAAEAALVLACSPAAYRRLECGREELAPEQARLLAQYYGIPPFYFMQPAGQAAVMERMERLRAEIAAAPPARQNKLEQLAWTEERHTLLLELLTAQEQLLALMQVSSK